MTVKRDDLPADDVSEVRCRHQTVTTNSSLDMLTL